MQLPPFPPDEVERLAALRALRILDTPPEVRFDRLTRLAARTFGVPIALVSLVDARRQWFKARVGVDVCETPREISFCAHAIAQQTPLVIEDARADARFADNPLVTAAPHIRFYAGIPVRDPNGHAVGTLCVIDTAPRTFTAEQTALLALLAELVESELATHDTAEVVQTLAATKAAVRQERDFTSTLLDTVGALVVVLAPDGRIVRFNHECERITGYRSAEALGQRVLSMFVPAEEREGVGAVLAQLLTGRFPVQHENHWCTRGGARRLISWTNTAMLDREGSVEFVVSTGVDVTEQREAELALRSNEERMRMLAEVAFDGIVVTDEGTIIDVNEAFARMAGYEHTEELIGQAVIEYVAPESRVKVLTAIAERSEAPYEGVAQRRDGRKFDCEIVGKTFDAHGRTLRITAIRDVSERKRLERMKDQFVAVVSHDMKNPLNTLNVSLAILAHEVVAALSGKAAEDAAFAFEMAQRAVSRLLRLTSDLLDQERLNTGNVTLSRRECHTEDLFEDTQTAMREQAQAADVQLVIAPEPDQVFWGDPDRLLQVMVNLVGNAIKFSPPGSTITLRAEEAPDEVRLSVSDQGRGIPADKLEAIFERFVQVEETDATLKGGAGLGLAICRSLVERHGGRIWAESEPGHGSTFYVALPVRSGIDRSVRERTDRRD